ncbi:GntR family transcriptional regulator [Niabella pedocola]|uniref:GntR family transcriptional regulator n=1 Tax=Niabella pedocola TaxID=1752077 RepID=A0ABS8PMT8_9BACT|nr:GntR family transcriptional regulator [Niabella pedocola]MCD2422429.1 GntR family transcriptional regulator [Niabella pedocola]
MKKETLLDLIQVNPYSSTSKYLQIVNAVLREIEKGTIRAGDNMPSINELSIELDIARDTVERGYKQLRQLGVIKAVPRRGYFIENTEFRRPLKLFLLFNKLSTPKKQVYDALVHALDDNAAIDFYIYNNDFHLFKNLLSGNKDPYTHYVIIPHFIDSGERAYEIIDMIPKEKLILLDKLLPEVKGPYGAVYIDYENDIYHALTAALEHLVKYHTIKLIFPDNSYYPREIKKGFAHFCQDNAFSYRIINNIENEPIKQGEVYINMIEEDLVTLIEKIQPTSLKIGTQVGIISYNETPFKRVILDGITTISSDFYEMGILTAQAILSGSTERQKVPFKLTLRPSL